MTETQAWILLVELAVVALAALRQLFAANPVLAATEWANLTHAGAFVVGAALGTIATIRVMRHVLGYVRRDDRYHDPTSM